MICRMICRMMLSGFLGMVRSVEVMPVRYVCVVSGLPMVTGLVVFRGSFVVLGCQFMMLGCMCMMFGGVFRHRNLSGRRPATSLCLAGYAPMAHP
jgi:hypothetical protein